MKPELKLGRQVIAWRDKDPTEHKGVYIYDDGDSEVNYTVLLDDGTGIDYFDHVKPDLTAEPMTGDEVEGYSGPTIGIGRYVGLMADGRHAVEVKPSMILYCNAVRFPKQSKREQVWEILSEILCPDVNTPIIVADEIDKIYKEES